MNKLIKFKYWILGALSVLALTGITVHAYPVSVPNSPSKGAYLSGLTTGNYQTNTACGDGQILAASSTSSSGWACVVNTAALGATTTITSNILINGPNFTFATSTTGSGTLGITGSGSTITFNLNTSAFPTFSYASSTFQLQGSYVTNSYASSTFPSFTYASSTYQAAGNYLTSVTADSPLSGAGTAASHLIFTNPGYILNSYASSTFPSFTYGSSTYVNYPYASSTFSTYTYGTSTYPILVANNSFTGANTFTGTSTQATTTVTALTVTGIPTLSGVSNCNSTQYLQITSGLFGCGTPSGGGGGSGGGWATTSPAYITTTYPNTTGALVGINTSTPTAQLTVEGTSGTTTPVFEVASSSNASEFQIQSGGNVVSTGVHLGPDGSLSAPTYSFSSTQTTGMYLNGGILSFADGGNPIVKMTSTQLEMREGGSVSTPIYSSQSFPGSGMQLSSNVLTLSTTATGRLTLDSQGDSGFNSSTPTATLVVQGYSGSTTPDFIVATSTGISQFQVNANGNIAGTGINDTFGLVPTDDTFYCTPTSQCFTYVGNDNTTLGSTIEVTNISSGVHAYTGFSLCNNLCDNTGTHYFGEFLSSSAYNDTTFGTALASKNQLQFSNTDGPITIAAQFASTTGPDYINFLTGGTSTSNERMRITPTGNVGINSSTPTAQLVVQGYSGSITPDFIISSSSNASLFQVSSIGNVNIATLTASSLIGTDASKNLIGETLLAGSNITITTSTPGQITIASSGGGSGSISTSSPFIIGHEADITGLATLGNGAVLDNGTVAGVNATSSTVAFNIKGTAALNPLSVIDSLDSNAALTITGFGALQTAPSINDASSTQPTLFAPTITSFGSTTAVSSVYGLLNNPTINLAAPTTTINTYYNDYNNITDTKGTIANYYGGYFDAAGVNSNTTITNDYGLVVAGSASTTKYTVLNGFGTTTPMATLTLQGSLGQSQDLFDIASSSGANILSVLSAPLTSVNIGTSTISSTSPLATLFVQGNIASTTLPLFIAASSSGVSSFEIDASGHDWTGGTAPTCGTGCSSVTGDDSTMRVVTGSGVTAVTVNFANAWKNPSTGTLVSPACSGSDESGGTTTSDASSTPTTVTINLSASLTSKNLAIQCQASLNFVH